MRAWIYIHRHGGREAEMRDISRVSVVARFVAEEMRFLASKNSRQVKSDFW
jgi:hypothetical protein